MTSRTPAATRKANGARTAGAKRGLKQGSALLNVKNPLVKKVIEVQNRNHSSVVAQKGIYGTGTGLDEDGNIVIRVYTTGADSPTIPKTIEGIPVLEVMTGPIHQAQGSGKPQQQQRITHPVPIGVSIYFANSCNGTAVGTLGCRLRDQLGNTYILSSNHVLCQDSVRYSIGPPPFTAAYVNMYPTFTQVLSGNPSTFQATILGAAAVSIVQPAPIDENCILPQPLTDTIGTLFAFVPFNDQTVPPTPPPVTNVNGTTTTFAPIIPPPPNQVDAAIAKVSAADVDTGTPPDGYGVPTSNLVVASLGLNVQKYGRTTGQTFGQVVAVNVTTNNPSLTINLPFTGNPVPQVPKATAANTSVVPTALVTFTNEVEINPTGSSASFAQAGDSGSLVVDMSNNPVALVRAFAGGSVFCGDITEVIFELQQQMVNIILTVDSSPSFRFSSRDGKLGTANPTPPGSP